MSLYQHVLAAIDLDANGELVLKRAHELAQAFGARLTVVHVVEYIALDAGEGIVATPMDLTAELCEKARTQLAALCTRAGVPPESARVVSGPTQMQILEAAQQAGADLIAVGHLPRRGWFAGLFSHTDQGVVSKATCDVLALKLPEEAAKN
jgi:universal stress protein A